MAMKHFSTLDVVTLPVIFLGSSFFLISSLKPSRSPQERQQQRMAALTGLLGLLSGGLDLCWDLGLLRYSSATVVVYFSRHLLRGIVVALLVVMIFPKSTKLLLALSVALLIAFNLFAISQHDPMLRGLKNLFSLANWFLVGASVPWAIFVWHQRKSERKNGDDAAAIHAATGKET
jgi:hypothetical protein